MDVQVSSSSVDYVGYVAGILTTLAFVPQVIKTWHSRSAGDLSATMLTTFTIGLLLWLVYGVALASWPLVLSNAVTLGLVAVLLALKVRRAPLVRSGWRQAIATGARELGSAGPAGQRRRQPRRRSETDLVEGS